MTVKLTKAEALSLARIIAEYFDLALLLEVALENPQTPNDLVRSVLPLIPGETTKAKVSWAISKARPAFASEERFRNLLTEALAKLELAQVAHLPISPANPADKLRCVMATPMFVMRDIRVVRRQAAQLKAAGFNAICSLVDLQTGAGQRDYIIKGRSATNLTDTSCANIDAVIAAGLTPILTIRNDWAVRKRIGVVPSVDGQPETQADFYSSSRLGSEEKFLSMLRGFYDLVHIQISIEPEHPASAVFSVKLAKYLRASGFKNRIFINPYSKAISAHVQIAADLNALDVEWARSHNGNSIPDDPVWNTDGDTTISASNVKARVAKMEASQKDWILWTQVFANSPGDFPAEYLDVGLMPSAPSGSEGLTGNESGFLWKPSGENTKKLVVLLPPQFTGITRTDSAGLWSDGNRVESARYANVGNGNREHYRFGKAGAAYPAGIQFRITTKTGKVWVWSIAKPASRNENVRGRETS